MTNDPSWFRDEARRRDHKRAVREVARWATVVVLAAIIAAVCTVQWFR